MKKITIVVIFFIILVSACGTKQQSRKPMKTASVYNLSYNNLHPMFKIFHEKDTVTKLYLKLFTDELQFSRANKDGKNQALINIYYEITPSIKDRTLLDSASTTITVPKKNGQTSFVSYFKIKNVDIDKFVLKVNLYDIYGNKESETLINSDRSIDDNSQFYLSMQEDNMKPIFKNYIRKNEKIIIKNNKSKKIFVKYYNTSFITPLPPFSTLQPNEHYISHDSLWELPVKNSLAKFSSNLTGIFRIQTDTVANKGITKINLGEHYPLLRTSENLLEALQYLLSVDEYENMLNADNKKLVVDNFWLKLANNDTELARELIKIWFNRIQHSNYFFTSYKEGWKTDRGMIYIVFGPPQIVKYADGAERWSYLYNSKQVHFIFAKSINSGIENDYLLRRNSSYTSFWYNAIDSWRNGKVFHY